MGYNTQEFKSASLSNLYPAYYKELQVINWCHVDIVVTESNGKQTMLLRSDTPVKESDAMAVIEYRDTNGIRCKPDASFSSRESRNIELQAKRLQIPFSSFRNSPIRIEEFNWIISTVEQSMIAKNMACEINFGAMIHETRTDVSTTDPRFVFQVIDPHNEFDCILVNLFGQTVVLRSGLFNQLIPSSVPQIGVPESARLICYLKYPTEYYGGAKPKQIVFEIDLKDIYKKEPFQIPSGDFVCIATNIDDLQEVVAKKSQCAKGTVTTGSISEKMIPKEVYDEAVANHKAKQEQLKEEYEQRLKTVTTQKNAEIADLRAKLADTTRQKDALEAKCSQWEKINEARDAAEESRQKVDRTAEQIRKDANDNAKRDIDNMWLVLKIGGSILSAVSTFALTMLVKSSKK